MGSRACGAALAVCVGIPALHLGVPLASDAWAIDWRVTSGVSSSVVVNDNLDLLPDPEGIAVGFINSVSADVLAAMPMGSVSISSNVGHSTYVGPGASSDLGGLSFGTDSSIDLGNLTKAGEIDITASLSVSPTALIELEEDEEVRSSGDTLSYVLGAAYSHPIGPQDTLSASVTLNGAKALNNGRDSTALSLSSSWSHQISSLTSIGANVSRSQSSSSSEMMGDEDNVIWNFGGQFSTELSPRLSASASAGFSIVDGPSAADLSGGGQIGGEPLFTGPTFNLSLNYALKTTTFSLIAADGITQTTFGDLRERRSFAFTVAHAVNSRSNLLLSGAYVSSSGEGIEDGDRTSRTLSVVYSHRITPYWSGNLSYTYRDVDRADGFARSNAAVFALSRSLTLVP